jgi:GNAT superfamily N-acetyltransferase
VSVLIREAHERDVSGIRDLFFEVYGGDYPYQFFYDEQWLKRSVFSDDILMLVAEDEESGAVLGTSSVVMDVGAYSDLLGEFGRLAVSPAARGLGVGKQLMQARVAFSEQRLHVGIVENRCVHPFSQRISAAHGFAAVGFLPMKHHLLLRRESVAIYCRHFGQSLALRANNPRVVPEAYPLAHLALQSCGLDCDVIVDEEIASYPHSAREYQVEALTARGLPALLRIERGRLRRREVFGPMQLQYGFFKLIARHASYLLAREKGAHDQGVIAGAVGFVLDQVERGGRIFELIARDDRAVRTLLEEAIARADADGCEYLEIDVGASATRMQRTLLELGFVPAAYVPAMVFHQVERLDVIKMVRLRVPLALGELVLLPQSQAVADTVLSALRRQQVLPQIAEAMDHVRIFSGLNPEQRERLAGACSVEKYSEGDILFCRGNEPDRMLVILRGEVAIKRGSPPLTLGTVGPGESLGERSLLTGEERSAMAQASTVVVAAAISREEMAALTRQRPDIGVVLYRNLAVGLGRKLQRLNASLVQED